MNSNGLYLALSALVAPGIIMVQSLQNYYAEKSSDRMMTAE
jgi:hypothetical protein